MKDLIYDYLVKGQDSISAIKAIEILSIGLLVGILIFITYRISFSGVMYNRKFNISMIMITMITTMVMIVIGGDISLSLGMVGALSIVRFRTAIKDPRDTAYIFWSIAAGISAGTQNYMVCVIGSIFISIILVVISMGKLGESNRYLLIIRGSKEREDEITSCVFKTFKDCQLRAKNTNENSIEIVYQIKFKKNDDKNIVKNLYMIENVNTVNMIAQNGETIG